MSKFTNLDIDFDKEIAPLLKEVKKATSNYTREIVRFVIASALIVLVSYLLILYQGLPQKNDNICLFAYCLLRTHDIHT